MGAEAVGGLAAKAGVDATYVSRLVEAGVLRESVGESDADAARVRIAQALMSSGIPLQTLGDAIEQGVLSLDFVDYPGFRIFSPYSSDTFADVARTTGLPVEVVTAIREAMGSAAAAPDDPIRLDELQVVPILTAGLARGMRPAALERSLRVFGESLRRIAETEADLWQTRTQGPPAAWDGSVIDAAEAGETTDLFGPAEQALLGVYHGQQSSAFLRNILEGIEKTLVGAGLHQPTAHVPAICFLDITGYTHLTEESGDAAAADLASRLARLVHRLSTEHGGRTVKSLGDGVMFYFPDPGQGVVAALDMVAGVVAAGLPPAHVGLHAGPVLFQEGDYFGRTVNVAARIADYARQGEVLVSNEVVERCESAPVHFTQIGPVELKGVAGTTELYQATRA